MTQDVLACFEGGTRMAYIAESLAALSDIELDDVVVELVMGKQPEPSVRLSMSAAGVLPHHVRSQLPPP